MKKLITIFMALGMMCSAGTSTAFACECDCSCNEVYAPIVEAPAPTFAINYIASQGNYVRDNVWGNRIGQMNLNETFSVTETITSHDGTVWGKVNGTVGVNTNYGTYENVCGYVCLDYCDRVTDSSNANDASYITVPTDNEAIIYNYCINQGMNKAAVSAVMANLYAESGYSPSAYCIDVNGLPSYGICQWNGERFDNLKNYCSYNGIDYTSIYSQLDFLFYELQTSYRYVYDPLINSDDTAEQAYNNSYLWASRFEVCSSDYWEGRADSAISYYWNSEVNIT